MPLLVEASVAIQNCSDYCVKGYEVGDCGDDSCQGCCGSNYGKNTCVLLQGLSSCTNLELTATTAHFILRKDLMRCPVFSNLKTVLLDEWCITTNLGALICFLQHMPVLEKLTLQFPEIHKNLVETGASYDVLGSYGLLPQKIIIKQYQLGPLEVLFHTEEDLAMLFWYLIELSYLENSGCISTENVSHEDTRCIVSTGNFGSYVVNTVTAPGVAALRCSRFMYIFAG